MKGPASSIASGWKFHDWILAIFLLVFFLTLFALGVHGIAPNSAVGVALHNAGQAVGHALQYIGAGFNLVASWFLQL